MARRRARRDLERRMRELDRLDRHYGLGADPRRYRRPPRVPRGPRPRWLGVAGGLSCVVVAAAAVAVVPGPMRDPVRHLLHLPDARIGPLVETSGDGAYAFEHTQRGSDAPVSYSPCRSIHYVVNPDGGPDDAVETIQEAVEEASRRSGFAFEYDGTTTDRTFERTTGPVLIGFARPGELAELPENGDAVGLGGSSYVDDGVGFVQYSTGMVALKASWFRRQEARGRDDEQRAVVMHELGHVLGLGHVDDPDELMFPAVSRTSYGRGDIAGLALLGAVPCG